ncbi:hypothetical protein PP262_gp49 [Streptococcus phage vB_SthS_VA460]|uniref:DUF1366 domain-containing protein n=1 Tax=Streptococcus phage vB_SthS_VA460 TaxID=2069609 RepID=A0A2I6QR31_9CAUD|nr:hypothetical protein PP262_gp49 [Streptococcus phage vB_SthS_VA460]AUN43454.1 hypothetical protein [Streptococcus phage vB_SthS_VA460]
MKFEYESKSKEYDASGAAYATKVVLRNRDGAYVPVFLPAEKIDLSNTDLLNEALEVIYQENFRDKYENEKFNEITKELASYKENSEVAQATLLDVATKLYDKGVLTDGTTTQN